MPRPNTIGAPTIQMSTLLKVDQLDKLQKIAHKARKNGAKHISAASLIRDAVDDWLAKHDQI